jgi:Sigma-70 region 2
MKLTPRPSFEDCLGLIDQEIIKRKGKWNLSSIAWMDFDDVSQIIRIHIYQKWSQYNPKKPLQPWISMIITNQIRNLIRNHYTNYARPCLRCDAAVDTDGCKIYKEQCEACPLFAHWKKNKQPATFVKLPLSIENHIHEIHEMKDNSGFGNKDEDKLHILMKKILKPIEYQVYKGLYIEYKEEAEVAKTLGFISNENGRKPGYRQIKNIQKSIVLKAREHIEREGLD